MLLHLLITIIGLVLISGTGHQVSFFFEIKSLQTKSVHHKLQRSFQVYYIKIILKLQTLPGIICEHEPQMSLKCSSVQRHIKLQISAGVLKLLIPSHYWETDLMVFNRFGHENYNTFLSVCIQSSASLSDRSDVNIEKSDLCSDTMAACSFSFSAWVIPKSCQAWKHMKKSQSDRSHQQAAVLRTFWCVSSFCRTFPWLQSCRKQF